MFFFPVNYEGTFVTQALCLEDCLLIIHASAHIYTWKQALAPAVVGGEV